MPKLIARVGEDGSVVGWAFWCPACSELHAYVTSQAYATRHGMPVWRFNDSIEAPTFSPSWRRIGGNECHFYVHDGRIDYCGDAKHALAGKTVEMIEIRDQVKEGTPMPEEPKDKKKDADPGAEQKSEGGSRTHHPDAGNVGKTGKHAELGSNAADRK